MIYMHEFHFSANSDTSIKAPPVPIYFLTNFFNQCISSPLEISGKSVTTKSYIPCLKKKNMFITISFNKFLVGDLNSVFVL